MVYGLDARCLYTRRDIFTGYSKLVKVNVKNFAESHDALPMDLVRPRLRRQDRR